MDAGVLCTKLVLLPLLLLLAVAAAVAFAGTGSLESVSFKDCGHGNVRKVKILSCKKQPCHVKIGSRVVFEATFIAPFATAAAFNEISAYIERHRFQLPEPHVDACAGGHLRPACPMRKGQVYTYRYTLLVREIYPATPATIEYKLVTRDGKVIGCSHIPVIIFR
ncbi:mite group 2 allergen Lep d 2-like [Haemaphysalis longicornis]